MPVEDFLVVLCAPRSPVAEGYRSLRATLQLSLGKGLKSLVVLSCWSGDGKSMVCANLAASLAQLFIKTVLIDGDLRKPTLSSLFEARDKPGLSDILDQGMALDDVLLKTPLENLSFMPAGTCLENAGDLLGRGKLQGLLATLADRDYCTIIDSPPLSACRDSLLLCSNADAAVMVASQKQWLGEPEIQFKQILDDNKIQLLGVILNGTVGADRSYGPGGYGGGYGYGYGQSSSSAPQPEGLQAKKPWWKKLSPFG